ncbi:DUF3040 domain-containing protein [Pseudarthrobacter sp. L1SW]|jgi:hypothetical protein|uniref:DUF3040 domain-containing protein n=1 Tax=Pseudarthrobacter sp. L1SW TaxID=2851598 RepID=UPI001E617E60|nr:DUF3040 domain-containing protein [Pseudarthrobacter sp. L1SW]UEL30090.1 DUF3040 domain-containing protein [Pseudarthrobacter sp. L1SW]
MALTEREQQQLEELEKQFKADDPQFAQAMESQPDRPSNSRLVIGGVLLTVAGIAVLLAGLALPDPATNLIIGLLGFATMATGLYLATKNVFTKPAPGAKTAKTAGDGTENRTKPGTKDSWSNTVWWALLFWWV